MAQDLNQVTLIGNLVRDCGQDQNSFQYLQNGTAVARVSIASSRPKKQQDGSWADDTSYFDITIFGKTAENLRPYLQKGKKIAVSGYLKQDRWKDQQGNNRSRISVIADNVQLLGGFQNGQQAAQAAQAASGFNPNTAYPTAQAAQQASNPQMYGQSQPQYQQQYQPAVQTGQDGMGFPEDIPF